MLHACVERFDVMDERENILGWDGEMNKASVAISPVPKVQQRHAWIQKDDYIGGAKLQINTY
jgi:hypothetical protein